MLSECGSGPPPAAFVYKVFDGNILLYVGITENVQRRMKEHIRDKAWWPSSPTIVVNFFFDIRDAQDKERKLIADLEPIHDRTWRRKAPKGPMPRSVYVCPKCKVEKSLARPGVCTCNGRLNKRRAPHLRPTPEQERQICALWYSAIEQGHVLSRAAQIMGVDAVTRNQMNRLCGPRHKQKEPE